MPATHINQDEFETKVLQSDKVVLVDFFAEWCGPCKVAGPVLDQLAEDSLGKYEVMKINVDENQDIAGKFGVMSIPTVILFKEGKEIDRKVGFGGKQGYVEMLAKGTK